MQGTANAARQRDAIKLLRRFDLVEVTIDGMKWASDAVARYVLKDGVDGFDCMIAAVSHRLKVPLYTRNLKHFRPLIGALAVVPYT